MEKAFLKLTKTDKIILESYKNTIEGLSDYMGEGYEFVLHSLENLDQSVIKIMNGHYSGRKEGAPITDLALNMLSQIQNSSNNEMYKTYFNRNKKGIMLKSSTIPIIGEKDRVIGLLCMNFYSDTPIGNIIKGFCAPDNNSSPVETFSDNIEELILNAVDDSKNKIYNDASISSTNKNKEIITHLYNRGIFSLKDSVIMVANCLGISKNTVYMHIRTLNGKEKI
ncbi:helix-turn-helix transcriptional regulator [Priestia megaterium]|uniref:helix-turn-helix transcriptional regulator n=1 Tax=Priestia megaterium TaxID=1404 RepID=UPI002570BF2F|nr:PAS domain-containing protein [Priestia megaterium]WJD83579.1 PAS domain-containing protein [Priestia megaterium]